MELYSIVRAESWECFGQPPKALEYSSVRKHLHAGVKDGLELLAEGHRGTVTVYQLPPWATVPIILLEVSFTRRNGRACDLEGDQDWLIPFLRVPRG